MRLSHLRDNPGLEQSLVFSGSAITTQLNQLPAVQVVAESLTQPLCQTPLILKRNAWIITCRSSLQTSTSTPSAQTAILKQKCVDHYVEALAANLCSHLKTDTNGRHF